MKNHPSSFRLVRCALAAGFALVAPAARAVEYIAYFGPVTVDTRRPDLTVAALDTPLQAFAASTQAVAWTLLNQGAAPTPGSWVDRVYLATNAAGVSGRLVGEFPASGPLGTNQSLPRAQNLPLPADLEADRDYWWIVVTDATNAIDESNEANNTRVSDQPMRLLRPSAPNLRVASVSASASPMSGQPVTISWAVTNAGTWSTGTGLWQDAVYLSATTNLDGTALWLGQPTCPRPLGTNESYASSLTATLPQGLSGTRYFIVQTDADNRVNEDVFEDDNTTASDPVTITLSPSPDLAVAQVTAPATALAGQPIQVSWTVRNQGSNLANGPRADGVWLSPDRVAGGDTFLGHFLATTALAPGQEQTVTNTVIIPSGLNGSFYFIVMADSQDQFYEAGAETNNTFIATNAIVIPVPDLEITSLTGTNSSAQFGDKVELTWVVKNIGSAPASGLWQDRVYLSTNAGVTVGSILLAEGAPWRGPLAAGASYTNSFAVTLPLNAGLAAGSYYLVAKADYAGALAEANEGNNTANHSLAVTYPDLPDLVAANWRSPLTASPGETVELVWAVTNLGPAGVTNTVWTEAVYLMPSDWTANMAANASSPLRSFTVTNTLPVGGWLVHTQWVTVPLSAGAGDWRFVVAVDSYGDVVEANETNNFALATNLTTVPQVLALQVPVTQIPENAANPNFTALVSRNGSLSNALTVTLASSSPAHLSFGPPTGGTTNIVIPAGANSAPFKLSVQWDHAPGPDQPVTVTATAAGFSNAAAVVTVLNTDTPTLSVVLFNLSVIEGGTVTGRVMRSYATAQPLAVALSSSQPVHLTVTNQVIIPADATFADFTALAVDDSLVEPSRSFSILVSVAGSAGDGASVLVVDNDVPELALVVSATNVMENAGQLALNATVYRSLVTNRALNLVISSSQPSALVVPVRVTIPANLASASFPIAAVDNALMDGAKVVVVAAQSLDDLRGEPIGAVAAQTITVQDDDAPGLAVIIVRKLVPEGLNPATMAVVSRNTPATNDLVVTLTSSLTNEATVPVSVVISNGQTSATFDVASVNDGVTDGNQTVTITASAPGLASGSDTLVVTDENKPDLVVAWINAPTNALTEAYFSFSFRVENRGLAPSTNAILQKVYLSTAPYVGGDSLLMEVTFASGIPAGQHFEQALSLRLPKTPGDYWLVVVADATNGVTELLEDNNVAISPAPIHVVPAYTGIVQTDAGMLTNPGPVAFYGHATAAGGGPAAQAMVDIHFEVRGYQRVISAIANNYGDFTTTFYPLPGEAGHYFIGAAHPGVTNWVAQDEFTMLGIRFDPARPTARVVEGGSAVGQLQVSNLADIALTNVVVTVVSHSANLLATANLSSNVLPALGDLTLAFAVTATSAAPAQASVVLRVTSGEGVSVDLPIAVTVERLRPVLVARPASLAAGMLRGATVTVEFEVVNEGTLASGPINVLTPALDWLHLASVNPLPPLAPGATNKVSLQLRPPADLPLGPYRGNLLLLATGASVSVPFNFRALSEAKGDLQIEVLDEFTLFSPGAPGVTNALVVLSDAVSGAVVATNRTDATGTLSLTNLAEAYYQLDITASNHASYRATILLLAGQTNSVKAFLAYETVQYYWTVVPTEIENRTRLVVATTFETFVPVPIVEIIPPVVDLLDYPNGGQFEVMITNHGWIAAQELHYRIPSHPCWEIKPMVEDLGTLPAFGSIKIPLTIRRLGDAGCQPCEFLGGVAWKAYAANLTNSYLTPQFFINAGLDCDVGGAGAIGPVITVTQPECCAVQVKLRIDQEAVITRDAFTAALELVNGSANPLTGVSVNVELRTRQGALVNDLFAVREPTLSGLGAVDGSGVVNPMSTGKASWVLIPTSEAAPTNEVEYLVSGTLSYVQGGVPLRIPLAPTSIKVLPNAALQVKYFLQRDVFSDDPFTEDVIEPSEPFALAVMLRNVGYGTARNVRITSGRPEIVENVSGLYIFFDILATEVAGQNMTPSLTANFGDLLPGGLRSGKWLFKSSLQGLFMDYAASFEHLDGLGDPRLSLIKSVEIHEMTRIVSDARAGADALPDYLVHDGTGDTNDWLDLPDTIYLSDGRIEPVSVVTTGAVSSAVGPGMLQVTVSAPMPAGWAYLRLPDPQGASGDRNYRLVRVQRAEGADLPTANFWQTDRTFLGHYVRPLNENNIHLLDFDSTGSYTLTYATTASTDVTPPVSAVLALPADSYELIPLQWSGQDEVSGSGLAGYDIYVSDNGGPFIRWLTQTTATGATYPGVAGHRYGFYSVAIDQAGNRESAPGMLDAQTTVTLFNVAPVLTVGTNQIVDEGATVLIANSATDTNAGQLLTFSLRVPHPSGAAINPASGLITWPTSEATGPSTNNFTVIVADNGLPPMSATGLVIVVVREVNSVPFLSVITNRLINEGFLLLITNSASDYDLPANQLTFSLGGTVPDGATLSTNGLFRWQPTETQGPSTNLISVVVTDSGVPSLSTTQQFFVVVRDSNPDFVLSLGTTNLYAGETDFVLVTLNSGMELTEVAFDLAVPDQRLTNWTLNSVSSEVGGATLSRPGADWYRIALVLKPAQMLSGSRPLVQLDFAAVRNVGSASVPLPVVNLVGTQTSGEPVGHVAAHGGRVFIVDREPLVDAVRTSAGELGLVLYGLTNTIYVLQGSTDLHGSLWSDALTWPLTNRFHQFTIPANPLTPATFYRAREW